MLCRVWGIAHPVCGEHSPGTLPPTDLVCRVLTTSEPVGGEGLASVSTPHRVEGGHTTHQAACVAAGSCLHGLLLSSTVPALHDLHPVATAVSRLIRCKRRLPVGKESPKPRLAHSLLFSTGVATGKHTDAIRTRAACGCAACTSSA